MEGISFEVGTEIFGQRRRRLTGRRGPRVDSPGEPDQDKEGTPKLHSREPRTGGRGRGRVGRREGGVGVGRTTRDPPSSSQIVKEITDYKNTLQDLIPIFCFREGGRGGGQDHNQEDQDCKGNDIGI